jgi:hypothetical protein
MTIVTDSYMGMILPEDISNRIYAFIRGEQKFPFIKDSELTCIFCLYGKKYRVKEEEQKLQVIDLAERTVALMIKKIEIYKNGPKEKMDSEFIRSKYINRQLQIVVEKENRVIKDQVLNDPALLSDCFIQHISLYNQEYFFQIYGPLKESALLTDMKKDLVQRMVMIGYNRKNEKFLPFYHPLIPLYVWARDRQQIRR